MKDMHNCRIKSHENMVYSGSSGWRSSKILSHYQAIMLGK
ncbi:hypothetical protein F383_07252 [Gossypium arboreum]|uniref:Uncharacterized protein n=1 Tax=Gossypium arboreum TaxID=29729 RepID=A0A0B0PHK8_GOSAR|nr:hypothetical protein F383_07252 [Gossypium arboreum]